MPVPVVATRGLARRYGYRPVLRDVSLELYAGQALLLVGPNGAGKTTLIRVLAGLLRPSAGTVERHAPAGLVGHDAMLYPVLTAAENLRFFARLYGGDCLSRVEPLLERIGLADRAHDRVATFSRGMTQRLGIARALLHAPTLLLLDEPLSGLDDKNRQLVLALLTALRDDGAALLVVSHQLEGFAGVASHMARLADTKLGPVVALDGRDPSAVFRELGA
ncbi:MAG TPA: ABC transporter ATP-binding protein [Gemmatimonadales bacterium]